MRQTMCMVYAPVSHAWCSDRPAAWFACRQAHGAGRVGTLWVLPPSGSQLSLGTVYRGCPALPPLQPRPGQSICSGSGNSKHASGCPHRSPCESTQEDQLWADVCLAMGAHMIQCGAQSSRQRVLRSLGLQC